MSFGYVARGCIQVLAAHALVSTFCVCVVLLCYRLMPRRDSSTTAHAKRLFSWRMAPTAASALVAWLAVPISYALWEEAVVEERVGPVALILAALGTALMLSALWRAGVAIAQTAQIERRLQNATRVRLPAAPLPTSVVESTFPVVALVGLIASRLFVARTVLEACTSDEWSAVMAHEQAHARARDNLRRLAMVSAPDVLAWLPAGTQLLREWAQTAELSADESAARQGSLGLHLASALVKVARLATSEPGRLAPTALYRGEPIADRVHRLLEPPAAQLEPSRRRWPAVPLSVAGLTAPLWLPVLHRTIELVLTLGVP
jgi:Zn-dependent protease with chaperone function